MKSWQWFVTLTLLSMTSGCGMTRRLDTMINQMACMNQGLNSMSAEMQQLRISMAEMESHMGEMKGNTKVMAEAFAEEE